MQSQSHKRMRLNILDILILILIVALFAGTVFRGEITDLLVPDKEQQITYTFEVRGLDSIRLAYLTQNTALQSTGGGQMGTIRSVTHQTAVIEDFALDGSILQLEKNGVYDAVVTATAAGFISESGTYLDGTVVIVPGMPIKIVTINAVYDAVILSTK